MLSAYTVFGELLRAAGTAQEEFMLATLHRPRTSSGYGKVGGKATILVIDLVQTQA